MGFVILMVLFSMGIGTKVGSNEENSSSLEVTELAEPNVGREAVIEIHKDTVAFVELDCIQCHGTRFDERAPHNSSILSAHAMMLQYNHSEASKVTADSCRECHKNADLIEKSAANIRKQVSLEDPTLFGQTCTSCHMDYYRSNSADPIWLNIK